MKKIVITNTRALASAEASKKIKAGEIRCSGCEKWVLSSTVYPAYNHPEAPPVCFDCLPEEIKKELKAYKTKEAYEKSLDRLMNQDK